MNTVIRQNTPKDAKPQQKAQNKLMVSLNERRKELKLTRKDIASHLGVSYRSYLRWEENGIDIHHLPKLMEILQLEMVIIKKEGLL